MSALEAQVWYQEIMPVPLTQRQVGERLVASGTLDDGPSLAATVGFSDVDTGLRLVENPSVAVLSEILTVANVPENQAAGAVLGAAEMLREAGGEIQAQPGVFLPGLGEKAHLPGAMAHGMLAVPRLWGGQAPHLRFDDRMILMLQLFMLTDDEYEIATQDGLGKLFRRMQRRGADLENWGRD